MKKRLFILCLTVIFFITYLTPLKVDANSTQFSDIKGHWAEEGIRLLVEKGAISGYPDGSFRPNKEITRAEFVTLIVKLFDLRSNDQTAIDQVFYEDTYTINREGSLDWSHWALKEINIATIRGIIQGTGAKQFSPDDLLTREQMAVIISNLIYKAKPYELQQLAEIAFPMRDVPSIFTDNGTISEWARHDVNTLSRLGVLQGYNDSTYRPEKLATRGEVVTILNRLVERIRTEHATIIFDGYAEEMEADVPVEVKEWIDTSEGDGSQAWHTEDGVYIAVKRIAHAKPCFDIELKSVEMATSRSYVTFDYMYPSTPYECSPMISTHIKVVKIGPTNEVKVNVRK